MSNIELKVRLNMAIDEIPGGISSVAKAVGLSYEAVRKWTKNGLPRTEWTGETEYSSTIADMQDSISRGELLGRQHQEVA